MAFTTRQKPIDAGDDDRTDDPDAAHFSMLMDALEKVANTRPGRNPSLKVSAAQPVSYNDNDLDEFSRLTTCVASPSLSRHPPTRRHFGQCDAVDRTGYTGSDHQHFDRLMSFRSSDGPGVGQPGRHQIRPIGTQEAVEPFGYSPQDINAFDALMSIETTNDSENQANLQTRFGKTDTSTRQIRIIDYDKQRKIDKKRGNHGDTTMKIRYFD